MLSHVTWMAQLGCESSALVGGGEGEAARAFDWRGRGHGCSHRRVCVSLLCVVAAAAAAAVAACKETLRRRVHSQSNNY